MHSDNTTRLYGYLVNKWKVNQMSHLGNSFVLCEDTDSSDRKAIAK